MEITLSNYDEKRRELVELNSNLLGVLLSEEEKKADKLLSDMKKEVISEFGEKIFETSPVFDERIVKTRLYKSVSKMPKGSDLHVHDMALLPAKEIVSFLMTRNDFYINKDKKSFDLKYVSENETPPEGYERFDRALDTLYSKEDIIKNWTVIGFKDSKIGIWEYFEGLFQKQDAFSNNPSFALDYYRFAFEYYCKVGIMHVEIHIMLTDDEIDYAADYLKMMRSAYYETKKKYPFFTLRIIGAGVKADNENIQMTKKCFLNAVYAQETIKDESDPEEIKNLVIGFDIVNEEDTSLPLHAFAPMLLKVKKQFPDMKLYIHGGESINASNSNLIDAYLLGVW